MDFIWSPSRVGGSRCARAVAAVAVLEADDVLAPARISGGCLDEHRVVEGAQPVQQAGRHVHRRTDLERDAAQAVGRCAEVELGPAGDERDRLVLVVVVLQGERLTGP